ncbi:conserved protein of unknown function [Tenacibaculum sp. 190524A02b]|uniref:DUF2786 domain-containing protein n=1 Tax=Tenacibaculum vairaonense TaxID=3137860 RepID=UPI0032B17205
MNSKREKIKAKIKALLAKTTDNGASKEEMEAALSKANQLMVSFFISEHDLKDPYIAEKCVLKEVPLVKSGYDLTNFYNSLTRLFDCHYYYNSKRIAFFGFEEDTELCGYFYNFIVKTCLKEKAKYMKSKDYAYLKQLYHGRTLAASFIKGFINGISSKMNKMYNDRKTELSSEKYSLMVIDKKTKVKDQFESLNMKIKSVSMKQIIAEESAFNQGKKIGKNINLVQGVNQSKKQSTLSLNL